jgi:hypothetical protein
MNKTGSRRKMSRTEKMRQDELAAAQHLLKKSEFWRQTRS